MRHEFKDSTSLSYAEYNEAEKILTVCFTSGKEYLYEDVPKEIYDDLIAAPSAGRFFQSRIKSVYKLHA